MNGDKKSNKNTYGAGALFIPAGAITGVGVGFLVNNLVAGFFVGTGVGFALFGLIAVIGERTKSE